MAAQTTSIPATHMLRLLLQNMRRCCLRRSIRTLLALDPQQEEFWDQLSELDPMITLIESRSNSFHQEIDELIDQLPEDVPNLT